MSARGRPATQRGAAAEREIAAWLCEQTGWPVTRRLGAGRKLDEGDLWGVPECTVQVVSRTSTTDLAAAMRRKPGECERQQANAGTRFGVTLARIVPGLWAALLTETQFSAYVPDDAEPHHAQWSGLWWMTVDGWLHMHREAMP